MKKFLGILVLGLMWCNIASAGMVYLKCYWKTRYYPSVAENPLDKWGTTEYVNSDTPGYVAFDKRFVYYRYDDYEAEFKYKIPIKSFYYPVGRSLTSAIYIIPKLDFKREIQKRL